MLKQNFLLFTEIAEEIMVITYIAGEGRYLNWFYSPETKHSIWSDRELHGKCLILEAQDEISNDEANRIRAKCQLRKRYHGVGSLECQGVNNVPRLPKSHMSIY
jgi:aconitase B